MKLPFAPQTEHIDRPLQLRRLIISFVLTAGVSSACAVGALITGRDQLVIWVAVMFAFITGEFFYALRLTHRHATSKLELSRKEFLHRRKRLQRKK